jgi:hypothetical protein
VNKETLLKKGGFVNSDLIEYNEVWKHADLEAGKEKDNFIVEHEVKFFVRQASWLEFSKSVEGRKYNPGETEPLNNEALAVSSCIRLGEEGEEKLTYDEVISLEASLYYIFRKAVYEIYTPKKN